MRIQTEDREVEIVRKQAAAVFTTSRDLGKKRVPAVQKVKLSYEAN